MPYNFWLPTADHAQILPCSTQPTAMGLFEEDSSSKGRHCWDDKANSETWSSNTNSGKDGAMMGTDEGNSRKPGNIHSWLRDDCLEFYRKELLLTCGDSSSNSKPSRSPAIKVKDRVSLLRLGINRAMGVKKRFPNAQFLEFGVHEGKDLVRMAVFLRSIEEQKSSKVNNTNTDKKPLYTTFHGFDSFEGLPEDWINGQFGADDKPFHRQGAFDTGGKFPDVGPPGLPAPQGVRDQRPRK